MQPGELATARALLKPCEVELHMLAAYLDGPVVLELEHFICV